MPMQAKLKGEMIKIEKQLLQKTYYWEKNWTLCFWSVSLFAFFNGILSALEYIDYVQAHIIAAFVKSHAVLVPGLGKLLKKN